MVVHRSFVISAMIVREIVKSRFICPSVTYWCENTWISKWRGM